MHRIDGPGSTQNGRFQEGDNNQLGTVVSADWLNAVQDEMIQVVKASGQSLDKGNNKQLSRALASQYASQVANYDQLRRSNIDTSATPLVLVAGRTRPGDGGEGVFAAIPAHSGKDNDGTLLKAANGALWQRLGNLITPQMFGASGNGASNDTNAFKAVADFLAQSPHAIGKFLRIPATDKFYKITDTIHFRDFVKNPLYITFEHGAIIHYEGNGWLWDLQNYKNSKRAGPKEQRPVHWIGGYFKGGAQAKGCFRITDTSGSLFKGMEIHFKTGTAIEQRNWEHFCENNTYRDYRILSSRWFNFLGKKATGGPGRHESQARTRLINGFANGSPSADIQHAINVQSSLYDSIIDVIGGNPGNYVALIKWQPKSGQGTTIRNIKVETMGSGLDRSASAKYRAKSNRLTISDFNPLEPRTKAMKAFSRNSDPGRRITLLGATKDGEDFHTRINKIISKNEVELYDPVPIGGQGPFIMHGTYIVELRQNAGAVSFYDNKVMGGTEYYNTSREGRSANAMGYDTLSYVGKLDAWDSKNAALNVFEKVRTRRVLADEIALPNTGIYERLFDFSGKQSHTIERADLAWEAGYGVMMLMIESAKPMGPRGIWALARFSDDDTNAEVREIIQRKGRKGTQLSVKWDSKGLVIGRSNGQHDGTYIARIVSGKSMGM
ncbi:MAG: hypothetical protein HQL54_05675 [Magnetococcales bacterium]|nr:hypothetical protein [Magnetococcales bacterium]